MLGAAARYGLTRAIGTPWATFWINVVGSFVLGALVLVVVSRPLLRPFLATGVIGAFTTFSTYAVDTVVMTKDGHVVRALLYGLGSPVAGVAVAYVGVRLGRRLVASP